jgi:Holliday junction DNA helicase RuvA
VNAAGVGYEVHISLNTFSAIQNASEALLHTYLKVSEDAFTLYGFAEEQEKEMFLKLISVSGVGAATARMMLSSLKPAEIALAISSGNTRQLESVKGIGRKTAERMVVELKDKMGMKGAVQPISGVMHTTPEADALEALIALGIGKPLAEQAIRKVLASGEPVNDVESIIKKALKSL